MVIAKKPDAAEAIHTELSRFALSLAERHRSELQAIANLLPGPDEERGSTGDRVMWIIAVAVARALGDVVGTIKHPGVQAKAAAAALRYVGEGINAADRERDSALAGRAE